MPVVMTGIFIPNKPRPCGGVDATKAIAMVKSGAGKNIHPSRPLFFAKQGNNPPPASREIFIRALRPRRKGGAMFFHSDNARYSASGVCINGARILIASLAILTQVQFFRGKFRGKSHGT